MTDRLQAGAVLFTGFLAMVGTGCGKKAKEAPDAPVMGDLAAYSPKWTANDQGYVVDLKLEGPQVDDRALDHINGLIELKVLSLYGSSITDGGLAKLKSAAELEALGLGKTAVTRRGLGQLERLPALRWVWVTENKGLTPAEIDDFKKKAVPGIVVYQ